MQKLLNQIEKEISKSSKLFHKASRTMDNMREVEYRNMTEKMLAEFHAANETYCKQDKVLTALYTAKKAIESINN